MNTKPFPVLSSTLLFWSIFLPLFLVRGFAGSFLMGAAPGYLAAFICGIVPIIGGGICYLLYRYSTTVKEPVEGHKLLFFGTLNVFAGFACLAADYLILMAFGLPAGTPIPMGMGVFLIVVNALVAFIAFVCLEGIKRIPMKTR